MTNRTAVGAPVPTAKETYETFLTLLGQKALAAVERHAEICEADQAQGYGEAWKRIVGILGRLAPWAIDAVGHQTLKFHIPDGKYRQQVFALCDAGQGQIELYLPDIITQAIARKIITSSRGGDSKYGVVGLDSQILLEIINCDSKDASPYCKPMLGWGRKALRVVFSVQANDKELRTIERLCECAAESWAKPIEGPVPKVG